MQVWKSGLDILGRLVLDLEYAAGMIRGAILRNSLIYAMKDAGNIFHTVHAVHRTLDKADHSMRASFRILLARERT